MNQPKNTRMRHAGFTMIEVLVSLLIIVLGLLGLAGLQTRLQQAEFESYQRSQALVLLYDGVDRINFNRETAIKGAGGISCFVITNTAAGTAYYGAGSAALPACGTSVNAAFNAMADAAMAEWDSALKGAAETKVGVATTAGFRGCVAYAAGTELLDSGGAALEGTGIYTVAVAWQGTGDTFAPTVNCANNLYGAETRRRVVSTTFRMPKLN